MKETASKRFLIGTVLLGVAIVLPFAALLFPVLGLPSASESWVVSLLVAGTPEMLCLVAIALLGGEGLNHMRAKIRPNAEAMSASRIRYYSGLVLCVLNTLPITLYAYAPSCMPAGSTRLFILGLTDIGFMLSLFFMGGEFWEKFRRLFIWEGQSYESN